MFSNNVDMRSYDNINWNKYLIGYEVQLWEIHLFCNIDFLFKSLRVALVFLQLIVLDIKMNIFYIKLPDKFRHKNEECQKKRNSETSKDSNHIFHPQGIQSSSKTILVRQEILLTVKRIQGKNLFICKLIFRPNFIPDTRLYQFLYAEKNTSILSS